MALISFMIATVLLILIPLAPELLRIRIKILKWIHWFWAANLLENHFERWVLILRVVLFVAALVLFYIGGKNFMD